MSTRTDCPRCGHAESFRVETAESPNYKYSNSIEPLTRTGFHGPSGETGLFGGDKSARMMVEMTD